MAIRMAGMVSGLDTDALVKELVSAYNKKTESYEKKKTKLEWKQEAWKDLNTKIYDLYSKTLSSLRFSNAYNKRATTVSDETKASVTASSNAAKGTQTLEVHRMAASGYLTGGKIYGMGDVTEDTALRELSIVDETSITVQVGNGETKEIKMSGDTTIKDLIKQFKEAGLDANFDAENQRIFLMSKGTGRDLDFKLQGDSAALGSLGLLSGAGEQVQGTDDAGKKITVTGSTELKALFGSDWDKIQDKTLTLGKGIVITLEKLVHKDDGTTEYTSKTVDELLSDIKRQTGENAYFDEKSQRFVFESSKDLISKFLSDEDSGENNGKILEQLGLAEKDQEDKYQNGLKGTAVKINGSDAEIKLNGAIFTSSSNNFNINGLSINVKETTQAGVDENEQPIYNSVKLVTDTDVDAIYKTIKNFITEYNTLISEMDGLYNADSAKDYEPLTDEEKEALSEKEVEKWEEKIKKSLLRRDNTLNSVASMMKTAMIKSFDVNGVKMSLSTLGIKTGNYFTSKDNEKNIFHIDGDPEDSTVSAEDDELRKAIAADPDAVADFFSQLTDNLYDELYEKMRGTTLSSAFTVYNDKQMNTEMDQYNKQISRWEDYVSQQEEFWYSKFTAMEKALSQLQSSSSALAGLLGG